MQLTNLERFKGQVIQSFYTDEMDTITVYFDGGDTLTIMSRDGSPLHCYSLEP